MNKRDFIKIAAALLVLLGLALGFKKLIVLCIIVCVAAVLVCVCGVYVTNKRYKKSEYYILTKNPRGKVMQDRGLSGEYRVYDTLTKLEGHKRFLFNLYLPKDDGETTEIDVIMLHESGIYVFESKNYRGWIFGSEYQKSWTQTLPGWRRHAHREHFMNPIAQNLLHLKWLKKTLADDSLTIFSYIVFGSDCKLKNVTLKDGNHHVLLVTDLLDEVRVNAHDKGNVMSKDKIEEIYSKLVGFCGADESVKRDHIENIERKKTERREKKSDVSENSPRQSSDDSQKIPDTNEQPASEAEAAVSPEVDEAKPETAADSHTEQQPETQSDNQPERQPEAQTDNQPERQPEVQTDNQPERQPEAQTDNQPERQQEAQTDNQPERQQEVQTDNQPERDENNGSGERLCPRCGSKLVIRRASRGEKRGNLFWGCSSFPKCRYIEEIPVAKPDENHESSNSGG